MAEAISKALGAISLLFIAACFTILADHRDVALGLLLAGSLFGISAIAVFLYGEVEFRRIRNGLGELLSEGDSLFSTRVTHGDSLERFKADLNNWHGRCRLFLNQNLSDAHEAIFEATPIVRIVNIRALNDEHRSLLHTLNDYTKNLKSILERYLSVRR